MMKATEIFTPGTLPIHTYYDRATLNLEFRLLEAIETQGMISSITGPSKSGKTVLCESVVGTRSAMFIAGGGIDSEATFWSRLRAKLQLPASRTVARGISGGLDITGTVEGKVGIPFLAQGQASGATSMRAGMSQDSTITYEGPNGVTMLEFLRDRKITLVVDDFHYIDRKTQMSLAQQFKEAARNGVTLIVISVPHRSDDAIRANPELRGRVQSIDIPYWVPDELQQIANLGFPLLNISIEPKVIQHLVAESISSPQLMQALCLQLCREFGIDSTCNNMNPLLVNEERMHTILKQTATLTNAKTVFDVALAGPKVRGSERTLHTLNDGRNGDIYYVLLKAISTGEPRLSLPYPVIKDRVERIVPSSPPRGVSITGALAQIGKAIRDKFSEDRVVEWDDEKETMDITDPYFLYYLRWSDW